MNFVNRRMDGDPGVVVDGVVYLGPREIVAGTLYKGGAWWLRDPTACGSDGLVAMRALGWERRVPGEESDCLCSNAVS